MADFGYVAFSSLVTNLFLKKDRLDYDKVIETLNDLIILNILITDGVVERKRDNRVVERTRDDGGNDSDKSYSEGSDIAVKNRMPAEMNMQNQINTTAFTLNNSLNSKLIIKEVNKLFFNDKLLSILNESLLHFNLPLFNYAKFKNLNLLTLFQNDIPISITNTFLLSSLDTTYFEFYLNKENFYFFKNSFLSMKQFEKKSLTQKLFDYIDKIITSSTILSWFNLLNFIDLTDFNLILKIILKLNYSLNKLTALLIPASSHQKITTQLLISWSDCRTSPLPIQEYTTHFLIHLLSNTSTSFSNSLLSQDVFLSGVSNHLESFSTNVKSLGIILTNKICKFSNQPKIFKSQVNLDSYKFLEDEEILKTSLVDFDTCWSIITSPTIEEVDEVSNEITKIELKLPIDSDDESDEESSHKSVIPNPLYIKQLLEYLMIDTKKDRAYEMQKIALNIGPTLIRQKSLNSNEVAFYSEELLTNFVGLSNVFAIENFPELILVNLIAVLVSCPNLVKFVTELLLTGDYSLQQRMIILSSISLSCRELGGHSDEIVSKSYTQTRFQSKVLPQKLHDYYLGGVDTITRKLQHHVMADPSEKAKDLLSGGKILRISRKLTKQPEQVTKPKLPNFYKKVGPKFYFPLINVWYASNGINIGHYSPILISHYIKTLTLILNSAYPSAFDLGDMVKEFVLIIAPYLVTILVEEVPTIESIVTGVLIICDIVESEFLINNLHQELKIIESWLTANWDQVIDNRVKSLCSGLILRLHEMGDSFERTIMNQLNSIY